MSRNKLYIFILFACAVGYAWIIMLQYVNISHTREPEVCLFKYLTNIPCPSCGSSRSVKAILHGDIHGAFHLNPLGFLIFAIMLISPLWITFDLLFKYSSFFRFYQQMEILFRRKWIAIPAILAVLMNWIWNIKKYL